MSRIVRTISPVEQAGQLRRSRVLSAAAEIVRECGYESLTVTQLVSRAGVSTRAFKQLFDEPRECVSAAFEDAVAVVSVRARDAYRAQSGWVEQIGAGLAATLEFFDERPEFAWLCLVHAPTDEPQLLPRCRELTRALADVIDAAPRQGRHALLLRGPPTMSSVACLAPFGRAWSTDPGRSRRCSPR